MLGLSVGVQFCLLGGLCMLKPATAAELWTLAPKRTKLTETATKDNATAHSLIEIAEKQHEEAAEKSMWLLGCRDISLGIAACSLWYFDDMKAVATIILSGMFVCVADIVAVWQMRGPRDALILSAGAGLWGIVGLGLWKETN